MPNWCENKLDIRGSEEALRKFLEKHIKRYTLSDGSQGDLELDFDTIVVSPKFKLDCPEEYLNDGNQHISTDDDRPWFNWYKWQCDRWGTKWNASNTYVGDSNIDNGEVNLYFDTAWGPSIPVIHELTEMYPNLRFRYAYFEGGCWFGGTIEYDDACGSYIETDIDNDDLKQFSIDECFVDECYYDEMEEEA
jgi:hypothetical protein